jgi:ABC-type amino acid transport substrate-binding protein
MAACGASTANNASGGDGSLDRVKQAGTLKVCAVDGLLPYSSSDSSNSGFEVQIAKAIAGELGVKTSHVWGTWDGLIPALTTKKCDAIIDGLFVTDKRKEVIDFAAPYYASGETILVRKANNSIKGISDLQDKKVGVLAGSVTVQLLQQKNIPGLKIYPDQNTIILELNNGRIDAGFLEAPSAAWALKQQASLDIKLVSSYVPDERFNAGPGLRKEDKQLREAVSTAVTKLVSNGKIAEILNGYGVPFFPVK